MKKLFILICAAMVVLTAGICHAASNYFFKASGSSVLSETVTMKSDTLYLKEIRLNLNTADDITALEVSIDSASGSAYDIVLKTPDSALTSVTDWTWRPDPMVPIDEDDVITITWANGSSSTWGLEVIYGR